MLSSVLAKTVRDARRALAWWALGIAGLTVLTIAFYPSIRDDPQFKELESYPDCDRIPRYS